MITPYHAKYFAHELTRIGGSGVDRIGRSLFDACVDLNPHQIDAALFAMRSPILKGVILADEVGLGKTIEAGLVICQYWAERRRRILVLCPAALRKQWEQELTDKFSLPTQVLDAKTYRAQVTAGHVNPFLGDTVILCSFDFAARYAAELRAISWDMVVVDEAHKLRNAYRQSNRMGQKIRWAVEDRRKILLTATPLQNSLIELYGLTTLIDDQIFGDLPSFRSQYVNNGGDLDALRSRLQPFCRRTLRRQVLEYVQYTERRLITRPFKPSEQEHTFYEAISNYLQRPQSYALPTQQRHLITLIVRKVLASSSQAVAGTLEIMRDRLMRLREETRAQHTLFERLIFDEPLDDDLLDELLEDEEDLSQDDASITQVEASIPPVIDPKRLDAEIEQLDQFIRWARSIGVDTKTRALLQAIGIGFAEMGKMGAAQKAVIFTESRRTQIFLKDFLEANGYAGRVLLFNGTNSDSESSAIYQRWLATNAPLGRSSGSRAIDVRTAIIEKFRDDTPILIATEAAAEGINLQFCALVINYDLPWNPQRIEQRIGRCHRYGQKFDVVVINFLNERNEADQRVYELLEEKFSLFSGVFGASDGVLGVIESGVDFERRILDIYQQCRTREEISAAFASLQAELDDKIQTRIQETQRILLEHFDEDVHARLKVEVNGTEQRLDAIGRMFWAMTRHLLNERATFDDARHLFELHKPPLTHVRSGRYQLISKESNAQNLPSEFLYRLSHPLGEHLLAEAKALPLSTDAPLDEIVFDISNHPTRISVVEQLKGQTGLLMLQQLRIDSFEREDHLLFSAITDSGQPLDQETCSKLFNCGGQVTTVSQRHSDRSQRLFADGQRHVQATIHRSLEENNRHFQEAREQLEKWAEDMELAAGKELEESKNQIKQLNRESRQAPTLSEQHDLQEKIRRLEEKKRRLRQHIFDLEDEIAEKRDALIDALEKRMKQKTTITPLFTIRWRVE